MSTQERRIGRLTSCQTAGAIAVCLLAVIVLVMWKPSVQPTGAIRVNPPQGSAIYSHYSALCSRKRPPYVCAHGGATYKHPPNTAAAYAAAVAAGVDCVELDASLTADLQLIALHDRDLEELLEKPGAKVQDHTWEQLQSLTWPSGEYLMTVVDAMAALQHEVQLVIVDVKTSAAADRVFYLEDGSAVTEKAALTMLLQQLHLSNNTLIWSKADELAHQLHQAGIAALTGYTVMRAAGTDFEKPLRVPDAQVAAVYHGMLDAALMGTFRSGNKLVFAWTVDDAADTRRLLELANDSEAAVPDGFVTNEPLLLMEMVARMMHCNIVGAAEQ